MRHLRFVGLTKNVKDHKKRQKLHLKVNLWKRLKTGALYFDVTKCNLERIDIWGLTLGSVNTCKLRFRR